MNQKSATVPRRRSLVDSCLRIPAVAVTLFAAAAVAHADAPGVGLTAQFEREFLTSIIDHHFSALRMTELAAGTDPTRDPTLSNSAEGTSGTPGFQPTQAKAQMDEIKSMARRENRMQREEIMTAQRFLREWYGTNHEPALTPQGRRQIRLLEEARPGADFDHLWMEVLSRHHYLAITAATDCLVASDLKHAALQRYCSGIQHAQIEGINDMREMLCKTKNICDYQPLRGLKGRHTGSNGEAAADGD
ncbi:DUF305 domain-containing protein [Variovorax sp. RA8]|uniref:DUF305 domain-containing protein n=1 Tax=Variovorax sp. (strain JCM 16519 / RA8) TaxID=662548 RepID=UPI001316CD54|nr:DUF305 domain-containing protein [Variovorax sp. RA8]VTU44360.1 hypothetical protein RA8P2_00137 [Variovorax sp. RA8]